MLLEQEDLKSLCTCDDVSRMDTADETDEDELLDSDVQMSIQESCRREHVTGSGRYSDTNQLQFNMCCFPEIYLHLHVCPFRREAVKLVEAIKQGEKSNPGEDSR